MLGTEGLKTGRLFAVSALALLSLSSYWSTVIADEDPLSVNRQVVDDLKSMFATVRTVDVTQARARIDGTLVELLIDEGDMVAAGQKLARVRDSKQPLQIAAIASKLRSLEAQLQLAQTTLERYSKLHALGKISQSALDEAKTRVDVVTADMAAARSDKAVVRESQIEGDILAPASGRVLKVHVTEGGVLLAGENIADIAAQNYVLRLMLPERHARFIKLGDTVLVGERGMVGSDVQVGEYLVDERSFGDNSYKSFGENAYKSFGDSPYKEGFISQVYPELDNGRVVADVTVAGLGNFFVGERARVWVATDKRQAFVIGREYIHRRYGLSYVYLANGGEVVVQPGQAIAGGIEVLSGLREGDVLVKERGQPVAATSKAAH